MDGTEITIKLTPDEALVLSDWLERSSPLTTRSVWMQHGAACGRPWAASRKSKAADLHTLPWKQSR